MALGTPGASMIAPLTTVNLPPPSHDINCRLLSNADLALSGWLITVSWQNASDDEVVLAWHKKTLEAIHASNKAKGIASDFIYLNDAADYQKGYDGIPTANLARMKSIRAKYDPDLVFTKLCSGGFKLD
jgi:hypothetical protein